MSLHFPVQLPAAPHVTNFGPQFRVGTPLTPDIAKKYPIHLDPYTIQPVRIRAAEQVEDWGVKLLKAKGVHAKTRGERAAIFVLDTAGEFTHPDLKDHARNDLAKNFSDDAGLEDGHGHGTHCAGLAAALDNDLGVLGVAPGAVLVPVKVLNSSGSGTWQGVASGIRYVADLEVPYVKIISMSLGASSGHPDLEEAVKYALSKGVFIVAAAGNSGKGKPDTVGWPAKYPGVLAIASIGPDGKSSSFSSQGPAVVLAAPGENNLSTHKGNGYVRMSGTSMATPHVAGAMALILSAHPEIKTPQDLADFLIKGATDLHKPGRDDQTGHGVPVMTSYIIV